MSIPKLHLFHDARYELKFCELLLFGVVAVTVLLTRGIQVTDGVSNKIFSNFDFRICLPNGLYRDISIRINGP